MNKSTIIIRNTFVLVVFTLLGGELFHERLLPFFIPLVVVILPALVTVTHLLEEGSGLRPVLHTAALTKPQYLDYTIKTFRHTS